MRQPKTADPTDQMLNEMSKAKQFETTDRLRQDYNDELEQNKYDFQDQKRAEKGALDRSMKS